VEVYRKRDVSTTAQ